MNRCLAALILVLALTATATADEVRLANGKVIPGTVKQVTGQGIEVENPKGSKLFPWSNLSAGTRHRHQPEYRDNFDAVLKGQPASARTNRLDRAS
jgi:hypothetical protein